MASRHVPTLPSAMVTRWRCRRLCAIEREGSPATPAVIRAIDGAGARIECPTALASGEAVTIRHPEAGRIAGRVGGCLDGEVRLVFQRDTASVAFALAVIAAEMSRPA